MDHLDLYKRELQHFRGSARAFAERHPEVAGQLASDDPDLERLIEAHAFLTAGVHARLDAAAPAFVDGLADMLLPHVLRGVPAATIVEFTPDLGALRARQRIARHRPLLARPVDGTACRFRTCLDLDLLPLELCDAHLDDRVAAHPQIRLTLRARDPSVFASIFAEVDRLRLYLHHASPALPATLMQWFARHCSGVTVLARDDAAHDRELARLPRAAIDPVGLDAEPALFPWPDTAPPAHRLHCTPAIDLFETTAEPLPHTPPTREHLVRADGHNPRHTEVHAVTRILGTARARGTRCTYAPLHDLSPEPGAPRC